MTPFPLNDGLRKKETEDFIGLFYYKKRENIESRIYFAYSEPLTSKKQSTLKVLFF